MGSDLPEASANLVVTRPCSETKSGLEYCSIAQDEMLIYSLDVARRLPCIPSQHTFTTVGGFSSTVFHRNFCHIWKSPHINTIPTKEQGGFFCLPASGKIKDALNQLSIHCHRQGGTDREGSPGRNRKWRS